MFRFLILTLLLLVPLFASADILNGPIVPQCSGVRGFADACNFCDLIQLFNNGVRFAVAFSVIVATLMFVYAGILYFSASARQDNIKKAHGIFSRVFVGLVLVLAAWLIIDVVMKTLAGDSGNMGPWNEIRCEGVASAITQAPPRAPDATTVPPRPRTPGGACAIPTNANNPCHPSHLACFGARANDASRVCMVESAGGNVRALSGSDILNTDPRCRTTQGCPSYSVGLWQINLTVNDVSNMGCPNAFTARCSTAAGTLRGRIGNCTAQIRDMALYNRCVAAAQNLAANTQAACTLFQNGGFRHWITSANRCGVR
jgi:hypothetical protein